MAAPRELTATEAALLGLLVGRERSGYDLQHAVEDSVAYFWTPVKSRIYALLPRLVETGYARRRDVPQAGRPDKHMYRITRAGERALKRWLEAPLTEEPERSPILLKVFFGALVSDDVLLEHVHAQRAKAERLREHLTRIDAEPQRPTRAARNAAFTRRYGLEWAKAVIRWAEAVERELEPSPRTERTRRHRSRS